MKITMDGVLLLAADYLPCTQIPGSFSTNLPDLARGNITTAPGFGSPALCGFLTPANTRFSVSHAC
jgi:hypothetical protein